MFTTTSKKSTKIDIDRTFQDLDLEDEDHTADLKVLSKTLTKSVAMKSKEKGMNNILTILNTVAQICESAELECDGQDELVEMITDAYDNGKLSAKEFKAIGKTAKVFIRDAIKEYEDGGTEEFEE